MTSTVDRFPPDHPNSSDDQLEFNADAVRAEFPVLMQTLKDGLKPVYLDSGASAQKPLCVILKEREVEEQYYANAYRGKYRFGARVDDELEASRAVIASFLNAESADCVVFCPGATAGLNMVAFGWGRRHVQAGDEILITLMEHHANFVPWQQLARERGAQLRFIPMTDDGQLDMNRLDEVLTKKTRVIAVCGMSNVLGTINPVAELARRAAAVGACLVVDGAQSVPHEATDMKAAGIDFLVFSGHKVYGPTGVGVICGKADRLAEMDPILYGGHMIDQVSVSESTWAAPPAKFEAGTPPIVQAIALGTAVQWVQHHGIDRIRNHEHQLLVEATERMMQIPGMQIFGPDVSRKGGIISFRITGVHPEDLAAMLDRKAVMTRHGHHCTMPLHTHLGLTATTRVSFAAYNVRSDVDALLESIQFARQRLRVAD
ncbi:MAG: aminotransferase class V-fold PLP-dependent enzyme [Planctomyces sp.]